MAHLILENRTSERQHRQRLSKLLAKSTGVVRIATAYVTEQQLLSNAHKREVRLLTSLAMMDVVSGATSLESVGALLRAGVACRTLPLRPRLHAKVYIFGASCAVVTSANFTNNGLDSNIEAGVETSEEETRTLTNWFDHLWELASPVTMTQLSIMQEETSALRREYRKLRQKIKAKPNPIHSTNARNPLSDSLQNLFKNATHCFVCNTDRRQGERTPTGGYALEEQMHSRGLAVAWEDFRFPSHMAMVSPGDAIFAFAKGVGIIGVGVAEAACERLSINAHGRLTGVHDSVEWRVPTRWLVWTDRNGAFPLKAPNSTFWNISDPKHRDLRARLMAHFLESE